MQRDVFLYASVFICVRACVCASARALKCEKDAIRREPEQLWKTTIKVTFIVSNPSRRCDT